MATNNIDKKTVMSYLERNEELKADMAPWLPRYQSLAEYFYNRKASFTIETAPGQFLDADRFTSAGEHANNMMASSLIGLLWPNAKRSVRVKMPKGLPDTQEIRDQYNHMTEVLTNQLDNPKAGFTIAQDEELRDGGVFGTSGVAVYESDSSETDVVYNAWDVKTMCVDENADGIVDTVYAERKYTIRQLVQKYGIDNVSNESREKYKSGKCRGEKVVVLHCIEPRDPAYRDPAGSGALDMPFVSIHIEVKAKKVLRESGYSEFPGAVTRFFKLVGEVRGRSPGMSALPAVVEMNVLIESISIATEKLLDPPIGVLDDGMLGSGTVDTSAGAISVINGTNRINSSANPVFPIQTVGEPKAVTPRLEQVREEIMQFFFLDRLLDLNNETEMTAYEAGLRNDLRAASLGSLFSRRIVEFYVPIVERTFNILLRKNRFGYMPNSPEAQRALQEGRPIRIIPQAIVDLILSGANAYELEFISPAMRVLQAEKLMGIQRTWAGAAEIAKAIGNTDPVKNLDYDKSVRKIAELNGADDLLVDLPTLKKERQATNEMLRQQQELANARSGSETARNLNQAGVV